MSKRKKYMRFPPDARIVRTEKELQERLDTTRYKVYRIIVDSDTVKEALDRIRALTGRSGGADIRRCIELGYIKPIGETPTKGSTMKSFPIPRGVIH